MQKYEDVIKKKSYPDGYPDDALDILKAMSFTNGKSLKIVGSMQLRSQLYAGDYDAYEVVKTHGNKLRSLHAHAHTFQKMVRTIQERPNTFIADIKCGSIEEWVVVDPVYNAEKSQEKLKYLHDQGVITQTQYETEKKLLKPASQLKKLELLYVRHEIRHNIIRWTPAEVSRGSKTLVDGRTFTLEEAFETPTIVKLDVIAFVQNNRYTDFSCIYEFRHDGKVLNPGLSSDIRGSIRDNAYVLQSQGNYFKMGKRLFALARLDKSERRVELLSAMFNGDLGRLYHVYGDIGTLEAIEELGADVSKHKLEVELEQFKGRLSNILLAGYLAKEKDIIHSIETANLAKLKELLYTIMTNYAKKYLIHHNLLKTQNTKTRRAEKRVLNTTLKHTRYRDYY
jgi:hypothetical protein